MTAKISLQLFLILRMLKINYLFAETGKYIENNVRFFIHANILPFFPMSMSYVTYKTIPLLTNINSISNKTKEKEKKSNKTT